MTAEDRYKGEEGGLYGGGSNVPPPGHLAVALKAAEDVVPRGPDGEPSESGVIGLLSVGFSNARDEFAGFGEVLQLDSGVAPALRLVNGAQSHMGSAAWADGSGKHGDPWPLMQQKVSEAELTPAQIQVVWMKTAPRLPATLGEFPEHAELTKVEFQTVLTRLANGFPNLKIVYLSSRVYAGYATTQLSPEPYAYEQAFAVRWVIQDQIRGNPALNCYPDRGKPVAPVLLWGPYLWANGKQGRKSDRLAWNREDFTADGTHPSRIGAYKVARMMHNFFRHDSTTKPWFLNRRS